MVPFAGIPGAGLSGHPGAGLKLDAEAAQRIGPDELDHVL
jgi:hypothetical protein